MLQNSFVKAIRKGAPVEVHVHFFYSADKERYESLNLGEQILEMIKLTGVMPGNPTVKIRECGEKSNIYDYLDVVVSTEVTNEGIKKVYKTFEVWEIHTGFNLSEKRLSLDIELS